MSAVTRISAGGLSVAQYFVLNSVGYPYSTTGVLANGSQGGAGILRGAKRASPTNPTPRIEYASGDDGRFRQPFIFQPANLSELELLLATEDMDAESNWTGLKKVTDGVANWMVDEASIDIDDKQICIIVSGNAKSADDATLGLARYRSHVYPIANIAKIGSEFSEVTIAGFQYRAYPTQAAKLPWGMSLNATTHGATRAARLRWNGYYPLTMHTLIGNGTATTMNLDYTPGGNQTAGYVRVYVDGTLQTNSLYTVSTSAKTIAFTTAPTSGAVAVAVYEATDIVS